MAIFHSAEQELENLESRIHALREFKRLHTTITPLIAVADRFQQVIKTWPHRESDNPYPPALQGERRAREALVQLAEETGDYALAASQLEELLRLVPQEQATIRASQSRIDAAIKQRERTRWLAKTGMVLVGIATIALIGLGVLQQRTNSIAIKNGKQAQENAEKVCRRT